MCVFSESSPSLRRPRLPTRRALIRVPGRCRDRKSVSVGYIGTQSLIPCLTCVGQWVFRWAYDPGAASRWQFVCQSHHHGHINQVSCFVSRVVTVLLSCCSSVYARVTCHVHTIQQYLYAKEDACASGHRDAFPINVRSGVH